MNDNNEHGAFMPIGEWPDGTLRYVGDKEPDECRVILSTTAVAVLGLDDTEVQQTYGVRLRFIQSGRRAIVTGPRSAFAKLRDDFADRADPDGEFDQPPQWRKSALTACKAIYGAVAEFDQGRNA